MSQAAVVMAGPLPPAIGGMASVIGALSTSSLASRVDLRLFETGKRTPQGRTLWQGVRARLAVMNAWYGLLAQCPRPVAHIHTCSGLTFFLDGALLLLARGRGAPTVLHIHGARFDAFLDGLGAPAAWLARWLARRAHGVIVLSDEWRQRLLPRLPGARLHVVANGVPAVAPCAGPATDEPPRFAFLGNLGRRKGVHVLLEAAAQARQPWLLDLAGGEEEPGFSEWTRQEIARLGLGGRVRLLGPMIGDAKTQLLRSASGFVLPSLAEGLPMALLEAMAARLPVVVTAVGAMAEVVHDGIEGHVVPPADSRALACALDRLAANPEARRRMGEAACRTCDQRYGLEQMVQSLLAVYRQLPSVRAR